MWKYRLVGHASSKHRKCTTWGETLMAFTDTLKFLSYRLKKWAPIQLDCVPGNYLKMTIGMTALRSCSVEQSLHLLNAVTDASSSWSNLVIRSLWQSKAIILSARKALVILASVPATFITNVNDSHYSEWVAAASSWFLASNLMSI